MSYFWEKLWFVEVIFLLVGFLLGNNFLLCENFLLV